MNDKSNLPPGQKVHAMANLFQRKATEEEDGGHKDGTGTTVIRTESHAARFNNARALFERLGESRIINRQTQFSIKHSTSKDDNLKDPSPEREHQRSPSPKKSKYVGISNGVNKMEGVGMIQNVSRKSDKPEKPEKPERKFNSKELIEKQKNWTSHFTKQRSAGSARCADIIRTVPGTGVINDIIKTPEKSIRSSSIESPPSPLQRTSTTPPEVKPRTSSRSGSITSPQKLPDVANVESSECPTYALPRKKSLDFHDQHSNSHSPITVDNRRLSSDKESSLPSPAHPATPSPAASSSGPSSPIHTEDEKQENESNEKTESVPQNDIEDNDADSSEGECFLQK
jgi:neurabin